jgi:hypothetical protein
VTGLILAVAANASTIDVARSLWQDPATRQVVVEAASGVVGSDRSAVCQSEQDTAGTSATTTTTTTTTAPTTPPAVNCQIESIADTVDTLKELGLPIGWTAEARAKFAPWYNPFSWNATGPQTASAILGWLVTALLVMLGAPFWFDLLTKLASLRSTGARPTPAANDPSSNTTAVVHTESAPIAGASIVGVPEAEKVVTERRPGPTTNPGDALKKAFGLQ